MPIIHETGTAVPSGTRWHELRHNETGTKISVEETTDGVLYIRATQRDGSKIIDVRVSEGPAGMCS